MFYSSSLLQATAWIATVVLDIMAVVYFILLCSYCRRQTHTKDDEPSNPLIMTGIAENVVHGVIILGASCNLAQAP